MKKKMQKYLSGSNEGFSLVELIIVIAIKTIVPVPVAFTSATADDNAPDNVLSDWRFCGFVRVKCFHIYR